MDFGRLFVMDNSYTMHTLGKTLLKLTDCETKLLETGRLNIVDAVNRPAKKREWKF